MQGQLGGVMAIIGYVREVPCIYTTDNEVKKNLQALGQRINQTAKTEYYSFVGESGEQKRYAVTHYLREMPVSWGQRVKCIAAVVFSIIFVGIPLLFSCVREAILPVLKAGGPCYLVEPLSDEADIKERIQRGNYELIENEVDLEALGERLQTVPTLFSNVFQAIARKHGSESFLLVRFCLRHPDQIRSAVKSCPPEGVARFLISIIQEEALRQAERNSQGRDMHVRAFGAERFKFHEIAMQGWFPNLIDDETTPEEERLNIFNNPELVRQLVLKLGIPVIAYIDSVLLEDSVFVQGLRVEIPSETAKIQDAVQQALRECRGDSV